MGGVPHPCSVLSGEVLFNHATGVDQQPLNQKVGEAGSRVGLAELLSQRPDLLCERFGKHNRSGWGDGCVERIAQGLPELIDPPTFWGLNRDDAHPQVFFKGGNINMYAVLFRQIEHGQRNDTGKPDIHDLGRNIQVAIEVCRIDHAQDKVRRDYFVAEAEQDGDGDHLIRRTGRKRIDTRQVNREKPDAILTKFAQRTFDRHPRVIPGVLAEPGEGVKEGRLARIGIPDHGHPIGIGTGSGGGAGRRGCWCGDIHSDTARPVAGSLLLYS